MKRRLLSTALMLILLLSPLPAQAEGVEPVVIRDAAGLLAMEQQPEGSYILGADIDMAGIDWVPFAFSGTLDGAGYTVYNLSITSFGAETRKTYDGIHRGYPSLFAGLFTILSGSVQNLNLLNEKINLSTDQPCFIAGVAGYLDGGKILNCSVTGRMKVVSTARQCGAGGIAGFGNGLIAECRTDTEIVESTLNPDTYCEEFLGGILASGYADVEDCAVELRGYTSVHGYVHNGGLVGLSDVNPEGKWYAGHVRGCSVDAVISFFEDVADRRAYCSAYVGEIQNDNLAVVDNETVRFTSNESKDFSRTLLPDMDENPVYDAVVTPPTDKSFGFTTYTNPKTGYSYTDDYTRPAHTPGEWVVVTPATYESEGLRRQSCAECGAVLAEEPIPRLVPCASCAPDRESLRLPVGETYRLTAIVLPADATDRMLVWSSSDETVAHVDENGVVTAVGKGRAEISCKTHDGFASGDCAVEVYLTFGQWISRYLLFGWVGE